MTHTAYLQVVDDSELDTLSIIFRENPTAKIIKYLPHKRCLLNIEKGGKEYFVKVYPKKFFKHDRGQRIHEIGESLWQFSEDGKVNFSVPKSVCWDSKTRTIWQEKVSGNVANNFPTTSGGERISFEIGKGVAHISNLEITPPRFFDRREQLKDSQEFVGKIKEIAPNLKDKAEVILALFETVDLPAEKLVPIHGDMHLDQWLFDGMTLILLDFEDFSLGEIERDLASFIVQIKHQYPQMDVSIINSFLEGFRSNGDPENERLMSFYSAHKWLAKAAKDENEAEEILAKALKCLEFLR